MTRHHFALILLVFLLSGGAARFLVKWIAPGPAITLDPGQCLCIGPDGSPEIHEK